MGVFVFVCFGVYVFGCVRVYVSDYPDNRKHVYTKKLKHPNTNYYLIAMGLAMPLRSYTILPPLMVISHSNFRVPGTL